MIIIPNTPSAAWVVVGLKKKDLARIRRSLDPVEIVDEVCQYLRVEKEDLRRNSRKKEIVYARHLAIYLLRGYTGLSLKSIGQLFHRDHTTVIHAQRSVAEQLSLGYDNLYKSDVTNIMDHLKGKTIGQAKS